MAGSVTQVRYQGEWLMLDPKTGERRPARVYDVRIDSGSRDRPKSFADRPLPDKYGRRSISRKEAHAEAEEIVARMVRRGVLAP